MSEEDYIKYGNFNVAKSIADAAKNLSSDEYKLFSDSSLVNFSTNSTIEYRIRETDRIFLLASYSMLSTIARSLIIHILVFSELMA